MNIQIDPNNFKFSQSIQVRWADLDPLFHVNNSIYLQYFEIARGPYISAASPSWDWHKNMFLLANINCNYLIELKMGMPETKCWVRTKHIGTKSFDLEYMITTENGKIHTIGSSTQVMFDTKERKTIVLPRWLKKEIVAYEQDSSITLK